MLLLSLPFFIPIQLLLLLDRSKTPIRPPQLLPLTDIEVNSKKVPFLVLNFCSQVGCYIDLLQSLPY